MTDVVPVPTSETLAVSEKPAKSGGMSQRTSFKLYLQRVMAKLVQQMSLSGEALDALDAIMVHMAEAITRRAYAIVDEGRTLTARDIVSVIQLLFPDELAKHAEAECTEALSRCEAGNVRGLQILSGLTFPISLAMRHLRQFGRSNLRVSRLAGVCLAACLEYIASEIIELAHNAARDNAKKRIKNRHVMLAICSDGELHPLLVEELKVVLPDTGVLPSIHTSLLPKKHKKRKLPGAAPEAAPGEAPPAKKRRFHPGTVSLRNIRKLQKSTQPQLRRAPLVRYCRTRVPGMRLSAGLVTGLQSYLESRVVDLFQAGNAIAIHAQRQMLLAKDLQLAVQLQPLGMDLAAAAKDEVALLPAILKPGLRRLSQRAGVKFMAADALQLALKYASIWVTRHMAEVNSLATRDKKRTINGLHLRRALSLHGVCLAISLRGRHASKQAASKPDDAPATTDADAPATPSSATLDVTL